MDFEPITTQEEFNERISSRLQRERETIEKKYVDYDVIKRQNSDYEQRVKDLEERISKSSDKDTTIADLQRKVQKYETDSVKTRLVHQAGLPIGSEKFIFGETEDDIKASVDEFAEIIKANTPPPPSRNPETPPPDANDVAMKKLLNNLTNKGD